MALKYTSFKNQKTKIFNNKLWILVLLAINIKNIICDSNSTEPSKTEKGRKLSSNVYHNGTFSTGNVLWDNILNQCTAKPSISCLQKNVYNYIDDSLGMNSDIKVADGVCFKKNNVDINKFSEEANVIYVSGTKDGAEGRSNYDIEDNEIEDDVPETPFEEVTDALYDKSVQFLVTHDMKIQLPEIFFHGATLKLSPRALTKTGALVHIDLEPKVEKVDNGEGRLFFIKKIKQYLRKKLVMAAIAIILVIKLIALKLIFVLPIILGVTTAKKMFLKLLLFLFPALSHIFKLCSWYHQNYHTTKYHHHHHLITHHHHKPPGHHPYAHPAPHSSVAVHPQTHHESPSFEHYPQDWELSGPGLGNEYIASDIHRNAINTFKPHANDANDIKAWGLGLPPGPSANVGEYGAASNNHNVIKGAPNGVKIINGRPVGPPINPYFRNNKKNTPKDPLEAEKEALIRAANLAARVPPSPVRDEILRVSAAKLSETNRVKAETDLIRQQQEIIAAHDPETIAAEKFYGALVERVDNILSPMSTDPGCRERAICSLYKEPFKLTPYSNLVSNELSKDSSELIPAADSKMALRYYNYVQAARDGQESKDCVALYPNCNINFINT